MEGLEEINSLSAPHYTHRVNLTRREPQWIQPLFLGLSPKRLPARSLP